LEEARFFELPAVLNEPQGADLFQYNLTVEMDGRRHAVRWYDGADETALEPLLTWLRNREAPAKTRLAPPTKVAQVTITGTFEFLGAVSLESVPEGCAAFVVAEDGTTYYLALRGLPAGMEPGKLHGKKVIVKGTVEQRSVLIPFGKTVPVLVVTSLE